ncbi:DUF6766 family protein [Mesorhizobium sp.]|uniref:DUF6766 family protein n=1 Tax=Mesorhizobium sp. TaxID=1871066 RepID=UPI000FE816A4|nr:DUF6766 family protein [Mesorhizobium sp.]RWK41950.1 MAG: hypothetical protein EOR46_14345 [Mesorhizobium sp.]RWK62654.1 MAG: hypothetical protein EOR54_31505 [Mesorhizobium sp.]RWK71951.1 MAG: hypothetical protein EOR50_31100 [Mesorhizobium sp.]RWK74765.1 MAG: hypothetical protein EOR51_33180 [Mesorhizobium sp.]RWK99918.1 MAG: hypothetical protein EOR55_30865 [Mesorhizobium sp.]
MPNDEDNRPAAKITSPSLWRAYSYAWITLGFFIISIVGHWVFGWFAYLDEQQALGQPPEFGGYLIEMSRDTLENWQSEFLQLLWQVGGLAFLLFVGSPQSKESTDRMEAKIDALLRLVDPKKGKEAIRELDLQYDGRHTDQPHAHRN